MHTIADRLKALRAQKGVNQDTAAEACNMSRIALARYETGTRIPRAENAARLADYYGVTVDYLLGREETPPEPEQPKRPSSIYGRTYNGRSMQEMYDELPLEDRLAIEKMVHALFEHAFGKKEDK